MSFETNFYIVDDIKKVPYFKDIVNELDKYIIGQKKEKKLKLMLQKIIRKKIF